MSSRWRVARARFSSGRALRRRSRQGRQHQIGTQVDQAEKEHQDEEGHLGETGPAEAIVGDRPGDDEDHLDVEDDEDAETLATQLEHFRAAIVAAAPAIHRAVLIQCAERNQADRLATLHPRDRRFLGQLDRDHRVELHHGAIDDVGRDARRYGLGSRRPARPSSRARSSAPGRVSARSARGSGPSSATRPTPGSREPHAWPGLCSPWTS